eukprot:CAMPEP_0172740198 /NCGR_PEP_ID=MMETSP1074-20121228/124368_1 /TAXON_ID=2916 /ORGANISM="Ceratium fusus, Strain PA161109" /LENGTH=44 /DNA_ID= /DNA_START= /DNA_END= /DNA_ORIENTATION=
MKMIKGLRKVTKLRSDPELTSNHFAINGDDPQLVHAVVRDEETA